MSQKASKVGQDNGPGARTGLDFLQRHVPECRLARQCSRKKASAPLPPSQRREPGLRKVKLRAQSEPGTAGRTEIGNESRLTSEHTTACGQRPDAPTGHPWTLDEQTHLAKPKSKVGETKREATKNGQPKPRGPYRLPRLPPALPSHFN